MKRRWMMAGAARCALVVATLFVVTPVGTALAAGPPLVEQFHNEGGPFLEEDLSEECGFDVQASFSAKITLRSFPDGTRLIETVGGQNRLTFAANEKEVTFIEVAHEVGRIAPDGTLTFSSSGRSWLEGLIGHWVSDRDSPDFIFVAGRDVDRQDVCTRAGLGRICVTCGWSDALRPSGLSTRSARRSARSARSSTSGS